MYKQIAKYKTLIVIATLLAVFILLFFCFRDINIHLTGSPNLMIKSLEVKSENGRVLHKSTNNSSLNYAGGRIINEQYFSTSLMPTNLNATIALENDGNNHTLSCNFEIQNKSCLMYIQISKNMKITCTPCKYVS